MKVMNYAVCGRTHGVQPMHRIDFFLSTLLSSVGFDYRNNKAVVDQK